MKNCIAILIILVLVSCKKDQEVLYNNQFFIKGMVSERETDIPLRRTVELHELTPVSLYSYQWVKVTSTYSNEDGTFLMKVNKNARKKKLVCYDTGGLLTRELFVKDIQEENTYCDLQFSSACNVRFSCNANDTINFIYITSAYFDTETSAYQSGAVVAELNPQFSWGLLSKVVRVYGGNDQPFMILISNNGSTVDSSYVISPDIPNTGNITISTGF